MDRFHPPSPPRRWLLTDERAPVPVERLAAMLPPGSGVVLRHDSLAVGARWRLFRRLARIAAARRLTLLLAGTPATAVRWGADGVHLRRRRAARAAQAQRLALVVSMPVHDAREARRARRAGASLAFVSPLYPTRSHPGAAALGRAAWLRLARAAGGQAVALGGMTPARARALARAARASGIRPGWAAIDAWVEAAEIRRRRQKRNCVPT
ncbi:thiamine phosphate synthase [Sphingopyxis indica]|uniref:thiamine phosphate synthase n=1 Tax=Sphingopyxis indica TaxID=436663 RepID=UPI002938E640|nr:thiamine phosphate synthase [Sphingopyxis indica]WOF43203.1 thiamine phosphate synthase [Sphingopyxis indica]